MEKEGKVGKAASLVGKAKVHLLQERARAKEKAKVTVELNLALTVTL
jgi:hypothetical protein